MRFASLGSGSEGNALLVEVGATRVLIDCGFTLPYRGWLEIVGTEGVVFVPDLWLPPRRATFEIRRGGRYDTEEMVIEGEDQIVHMLDDFGRAVLEGRPLTPGPDEAVRTLAAIEALMRSARQEDGRPVQL